MDSGNNETVSSKQNSSEQQEITVPGSSSERVSEHPDAEIFEADNHEKNHVSQNIPLQVEELRHGEEIVDQRSGVVGQGEIIVEDGDEQYMNTVQITSEDMYEAGFEFDDYHHLTEEQLNMVIAVNQQRQAKQNQQEDVRNNVTHHHLIHHGLMNNEFVGDEAVDNGHVYGEERNDRNIQIDDSSMQLVLTQDGGVNITDAKRRLFYISPSELASLNIDLNNLSNDQINQLLQIALPTMKGNNEKSHEAVYSRDGLDQSPSTSYHPPHHQQSEMETDISEQIRESLIGETVHIRTADERLEEAVVKYYRGNGEFKIQLMNGEFIYATLDQMLHQRIQNDHDNYQSPMIRRDVGRLVAQKRAAISNDDLCPPVLKRSYQLAPAAEGPHLAHSPNFCCPICDKKVFQKEPSYIVIRLPACDSCTREKIIVLDEQNS